MGSRKEHYDLNAAAGRTVRFSLDLNMTYVTEADSKKYKLPRITTKIRGGTLTPKLAGKLMEILREDLKAPPIKKKG